jgi:alpha-1,3-rhamnosyl/mannosyltransferase
MRITIDATSLLLPSAGVKTYVYYWLHSLLENASSHGDVIASYPPGLLRGAVNHERGRTNLTGSFLRIGLVHLANIQGSPLLEWMLSGSDLFHCSQHTARIPRRMKTTATIFDFSCWTRPETHTPKNIAATKRYAENILKQCDRLIAISAHAKRDAVEILGIPVEKIQVIYPGVADSFFRVSDEHVEPLRAHYGLPARYLLFVGCIEPRKNVRGLIRAYRELPEALQREVPLVIAGPFGWETAEIRPLLAGEGIHYLGYVPEAHLPGLFRGATAFVYPSYYEGFGLPVAQAMAARVPVITSICSSLPEVVGDGGLTVDPNSTRDLAGAMDQVLSCPETAANLASRGRARASVYQWPAAAAASLDFFHSVLEGGSRVS